MKWLQRITKRPTAGWPEDLYSRTSGATKCSGHQLVVVNWFKTHESMKKTTKNMDSLTYLRVYKSLHHRPSDVLCLFFASVGVPEPSSEVPRRSLANHAPGQRRWKKGLWSMAYQNDLFQLSQTISQNGVLWLLQVCYASSLWAFGFRSSWIHP